MIPFPLFEPDKPEWQYSAGDNLLNCLPVSGGWGGMPSFPVLSDALPADCRGLFYYQPTSGAATIVAGTSSNLYKLNTSTSLYGWTEVSKSTGAYSVPSGDSWSFTVFGDYLIAHTLGDTPQYLSLSSGTQFADLAGSPPTAKYSAVVGDFLVFAHLDGEPNAIQWSGINDAEYWTIGQRSSDKQTFPEGGEVKAIVRNGQGAVIVQRDGMQIMQFAPNTGYTFQFSSANAARGTISGASVVEIGPGRFYYLSEDGFFGGAEGLAIGAERVDRWFQDQIDLDYLPEVEGVADPYNKIIWWKYQTSDGTKRLLGYDWQLDRWCHSNQNFQSAAAIATPGITLEGLDNFYASLDAMDLSLDSRVFAGGRPVFAIIDSDRKLAFMTGTNKAATLETAAIALSPGFRSMTRFGFVTTDATGYTVTVSTAPYHGGTFTSKSAVSPSSRTGRVPIRADGLLHKFKLSIPAGTSWNHALGIDVDFQTGGTG